LGCTDGIFAPYTRARRRKRMPSTRPSPSTVAISSMASTAGNCEEWLQPERERLSGLAVRVLEQSALAFAPNGADDTIRFGRLLLAGIRHHSAATTLR
jgi:hypothetical protein